MAQRHVAVHGERHGGPDGGVVGGELGSADGVQQEGGDFAVENRRLQQEADEDDKELGENVRTRHGQQVVVQSLLGAGRQPGQSHRRQDVH